MVAEATRLDESRVRRDEDGALNLGESLQGGNRSHYDRLAEAALCVPGQPAKRVKVSAPPAEGRSALTDGTITSRVCVLDFVEEPSRQEL